MPISLKAKPRHGLGRGVEARATTPREDKNGLGRGVEARARARVQPARVRGGEGTLRGAAWAGRDPTVQAGRQGSETQGRR